MNDTKRQNEKETPEERRRRMRRKRLIQERRRRRRRRALILRGILVILFVLILVGIGSAVSCGVKQYNQSAKKKDSGKQETQIEEEPVQLESVDLTNVLYLSFESLIADADQAFGQENTRAAATLDQTRVTVDEFNAILEQLYEDGYILVQFSDLAAVNEDGVMEAKELMLPSGKKPLLLSETNVNYDLKLSGQGLASKLVLDENGALTCERQTSDGSTVTGAFDVVPCVEHLSRRTRIFPTMEPEVSWDLPVTTVFSATGRMTRWQHQPITAMRRHTVCLIPQRKKRRQRLLWKH